MKKIVLLAMGMVMGMTAFAQDEVETTISGDIVIISGVARIWEALPFSRHEGVRPDARLFGRRIQHRHHGLLVQCRSRSRGTLFQVRRPRHEPRV